MVNYRNIELNEKSFFLIGKSNNTIIDENDIKKYANLDIKCVSKTYLEYMNNLLSIKMEANNATILFMNWNNGKYKKDIS